MHAAKAAALSEAVSVRYAREQYALGFLHGRQDAAFGHADTSRQREFARFYVARCETAGRLVDVEQTYRRWLERAQSTQLDLFAQ